MNPAPPVTIVGIGEATSFQDQFPVERGGPTVDHETGAAFDLLEGGGADPGPGIVQGIGLDRPLALPGDPGLEPFVEQGRAAGLGLLAPPLVDPPEAGGLDAGD